MATLRLLTLSCCLTLAACANNQPLVGASANAANGAANGTTPASNTLQVSDIAIPAGAKLDTEKSLILGASDKWLGRIVLKTDQPPVQVFNHFYNGMANYGWSVFSAVQAQVSIQTFQRGDRVATIQIEPASMGGSQVSITVTARQMAEPAKAK